MFYKEKHIVDKRSSFVLQVYMIVADAMSLFATVIYFVSHEIQEYFFVRSPMSTVPSYFC